MHAHRFARAVSVGNPREFLQAEKEEQEMAEACKRLIKNCIICWNYLYLSQKLENSEDTAIREAFLEAVANGSAAAFTLSGTSVPSNRRNAHSNQPLPCLRLSVIPFLTMT